MCIRDSLFTGAKDVIAAAAAGTKPATPAISGAQVDRNDYITPIITMTTVAITLSVCMSIMGYFAHNIDGGLSKETRRQFCSLMVLMAFLNIAFFSSMLALTRQYIVDHITDKTNIELGFKSNNTEDDFEMVIAGSSLGLACSAAFFFVGLAHLITNFLNDKETDHGISDLVTTAKASVSGALHRIIPGV